MENFTPGKMLNYFPGDTYVSPVTVPNLVSRVFPSPSFYARVFLKTTHWLTSRAAKGLCDDEHWCYASAMVAEDCERSGLRFHVMGMDILEKMDGPCVIVANHMSTLETFILPAIVRPRFPVTFIVKRSLVEMRFFGPVMRSRDPVVVDRKNPREDLTTIMREGVDRLKKGVSVIVFPQYTRALHFDPSHFNTIGVKLARKAGVPVVPLALKTDAWGQGKKIKELGPVRPDNDVMFRFFPPITIEGSGHAEHKAILECISSHMNYWTRRQEAKDAGKPVPPVLDPDFTLPEVQR
ncbi:MAG: lysophospholipid acyltransferase family protein [Desulfovibrionaceae bacterium]|nr:lysophospholipid acyltransferase family protein [Desulfovibrionaceae bacterium]